MAAVTAALMAEPERATDIVARAGFVRCALYAVEDLLPRFGVESTLVDGADLDAWRRRCVRTRKTAFLELPTNPTLELVDIAGVAGIMHGAGATWLSTTCSRRPCCSIR